MSDSNKCELCGEPMPANEQIFAFHGFSGPCPKPPLPHAPNATNPLKMIEMIESLERDFIAGLSDQDIERRLAEVRASLPDVERVVRIIEEVRDRSDVPAVCACRLDEAVFRLRTPAVAYSYTPTITGSSEPMFDVAMSPDGETFKVAERAPAVASAPDADVAWDA